jgi:hypothetical protein
MMLIIESLDCRNPSSLGAFKCSLDLSKNEVGCAYLNAEEIAFKYYDDAQFYVNACPAR